MPGLGRRIHHLVHLGGSHIAGVNTTHRLALEVDLEHDPGRGFEVLAEELLQHHDHKLHRCVVVIEHDHLVHLGRLGALRSPLQHHGTVAFNRWNGLSGNNFGDFGGHGWILSVWPLQPREGLAKLRHLGRGHRQAITLVWVPFKEVLVILFCRPVIGQRQHFGHDGTRVSTAALKFCDQRQGFLLLPWGSEINAATVLRAMVMALGVQGGGVVYDKENLQNFTHTDLRRVIHQLHNFVVPCAPGAHLLVAWLPGFTIAITRLDVAHPADLHKHGLCAPEAATPKNDGLKVVGLL